MRERSDYRPTGGSAASPVPPPYARKAAEADARLCRGATALGIGCAGDRWSPGAVPVGAAPVMVVGTGPFHRGQLMPKENLGGFGGQSHPSDNKAAPAGRRPMTPLERTAARPVRKDSIPT